MKKTQKSLNDEKLLRQKTEEHLAKSKSVLSVSATETDILKLTHELEEHKIELEIINKKLEQALQINFDKDRFISILAHDLRSPFSVLLGYTELLLEKIPDLNTIEIEKLVKEIKKTTQETFNLLEDLLRWSRFQSGSFPFKPQFLDINEILKEITDTLSASAKAKNIKISYSVSDKSMVFADSYMLKTILKNILTNSIIFAGNYGEVIITAKRSDSGSTFSISENGTGRGPENISSLFDITQVKNSSGAEGEYSGGLELVLCRGYVEKHGGTIKAESISGGDGTVFHFNIPDNPGYEQRHLIAGAGVLPNVAKLKILISDDNESIRMILGEMVRMYSSEVLFAKSGDDAVEIFQNNPDIDLILMDFYMPGMNGFDATQKIRQINKEVIIIVETADTLSNITEEFAGVKINDYFPKPFNKIYLDQLIKKHFMEKITG